MSTHDNGGAASAAPLDQALALAARGWPVLWLKPQSKLPATAHGVHDATTDPDTIRGWAASIPDGNIGVATGAPGPTVLDIDDPQAAADLVARCSALGAPVVATARGQQFYFGGTDSGTVGLGYGELRGRGSYVVCPPSVHPSGKVYVWLAEPNGRLPAVPDGVVPKREAAARAEELPPVIGDHRNVTLTSLAGTLRRRGCGETEILAALDATNRERCRPPLDARELRGIARSIGKYPTAQAQRAGVGRLTYGHQVKLVKPKWLVPGRIPKGGITLVSGDPGQGKSSYTCLIAAAVTQGAWGADPAAVVFASAEDSFAGRIVQRAIAAGARRELVAAFDIHDEHGGRNMELPEDVTELATVVAEIGARLVVVDPLNAHLSTALDSFKDHGIRKALAPLARMADELDLAVVVVCHLNKNKGGDPLYRTGGSIGYVGAARSVLGFGPDPEDEDGGALRLVEHVKSNWSDLAPTEQYRMEAASVLVDDDVHDTNRLVYVGEVDRDAGAAFGKRAPEDRGADAEEAIADLLSSGPRSSRTVKTEVMTELSCSERTVIRAAKRMEDAGDLVVEPVGRSTNWRLVTGDNVGVSRVTSQQSESESPVTGPNPHPAIGDTATGDTSRVTSRVTSHGGFDMARYRELRARAVGPVPFDKTQRTGFWRRVVDS